MVLAAACAGDWSTTITCVAVIGIVAIFLAFCAWTVLNSTH